MKRRYVSIPSDLAEDAWEKYTRFGIDIVARRDRDGNSVELQVPYYSGGPSCAYKITREGDNVKAKPFRSRFRCRLSKQEKQRLLVLFQKIDEYEPPPLPKSPVIVTEAA